MLTLSCGSVDGAQSQPASNHFDVDFFAGGDPTFFFFPEGLPVEFAHTLAFAPEWGSKPTSFLDAKGLQKLPKATTFMPMIRPCLCHGRSFLNGESTATL